MGKGKSKGRFVSNVMQVLVSESDRDRFFVGVPGRQEGLTADELCSTGMVGLYEPATGELAEGLESQIDPVRDLVLAVEYLRQVCEYVEGKGKEDDRLLSNGMCLAIRIAKRYGEGIGDYHKESFWQDMAGLGERYGMKDTE